MSFRLLFLCLFLFGKLAAQPMPCGQTAMMSTDCLGSCVVCDINGFTGINNSNVQGEAPPGFCTTEVHHMQWIAFIAGSTNLTLSVKLSNCQNGNGLEIGIFQSLDCATFQAVSNCDTDLQPNETGVFTNTVPLVIGQYYYFVMDGSSGDICNYTVSVTSGSTLVAGLPPAGLIAGPSEICTGGSYKYSIFPVTGATFYEWSVDGILVDTTASPITFLSFLTAGNHQICVNASNVCDEGQPTCFQVNAQPLQPTLLEIKICENDSFYYDNQLLTSAGIYQYEKKSIDGCDSLVILELTEIPPVLTNLNVTICTVDSFQVGAKVFKTAGNFDIFLTAFSGCDSIVKLNLITQICPINGTATDDNLSCGGDQNGEILVKMDDGTGPYSVAWAEILTGQPNGTSNIGQTMGSTTISGLPAGLFGITVTDFSGKIGYMNAEITQPTPLNFADSTIIYGDFEISCSGFSDGEIRVFPKGGNAPYLIEWGSGNLDFLQKNLATGNYFFTITDAKGCTFSASKMLDEPPPISFELEKIEPGCAPSNDGSILIKSVVGGQNPYQFALNSTFFKPESLFSGLSPGDYFVKIKDKNGCQDSLPITLFPPKTIDIDLGDDLQMELGDSLQLLPIVAQIPAIWTWNLDAGLSCYDCPRPFAMPLNDQIYTLTIEPENGCPTSDSVKISVIKIRRVFVPNIFSPNDDGSNDFLPIFSGKGTKKVRIFQIWSRWGELVFERKNFEPNNLIDGWDGSFRGKKMLPDVYSWRAEVEFIDGFLEKRAGDATLVR
jgi:gliding motility-associated-like protein